MTQSIRYNYHLESNSIAHESNISLSLETIALGCYRPMHLTLELISNSYFSIIKSPSLYEKAKKIALVVATILFSPLCLVLWASGGFIDAIHFYAINRRGFSVLNGCASSKNEVRSIFSLNACMLFGPLPMFFGGVSPAHNRIKKLEGLISDKKPDVIFLQEVSRPAARLLWSHIKKDYAFGISSVSPQPFILMDSGIFAAFRTKPLNIEHISLPTNKLMHRSLMMIETQDSYFLTTHLESGQELEDKNMRKEQIQKIAAYIDQLVNKDKPLYLFGDFNLLRTFQKDCDYLDSNIENKLINLDQSKMFNSDSATCTNFLTAYLRGAKLDSEEDELIDYAFAKNIDPRAHALEKVHTYDKSCPSEALSDHKGLLVTVLL